MRRIGWAFLVVASCAHPSTPLSPILPPTGGKTVQFPSFDADINAGHATPLAALLFRSAGKGKHGAIVALSDCGGISDSDIKWARDLAAHGETVLLPDSFGPRGVKDGCTDLRVVTRQRWRDAYASLAFVRAQSFVSGKHVAVMGWGDGALTTIAAAGKKPEGADDFRAAIAVRPDCAGPLTQMTYAPKMPLYIFTGASPSPTCAELGRRRIEIKLAPGDGAAELPDILFKHLSLKS